MVDAIVEIENEGEYEANYPLIHETISTHCETAQELIEALLEIKGNDYRKYIFRGQNQSHWSVIASLFRRDFFAKEVIEKELQSNEAPDDYDYLKKYYFAFLKWEYHLANGFANDCMNQGIVFPYVPQSKLPKSTGMGEIFEYEDATFLVARNYGLPTRLVDFTYSPLVAAWFAVEGVRPVVSSKRYPNVVVWAINVSFLESFLGWTTISTSWANSQIPQMLRQQAALLFDAKSEDHFISTGKFQPLEYSIERYLAKNANLVTRTKAMHRFTLPHIESVNLMQKLMCNYDLSEIYLFPTLDRIAQHTLAAYGQHARILSFMQDADRRDRSQDL